MRKTASFLTILYTIYMSAGVFTANAQTIQEDQTVPVQLSLTGTISSSIKNAIDSSKENAASNSVSRNQLVAGQTVTLQDKERSLGNTLTSTLLNFENIQTLISAKTAEVAASGTDASEVNAWLASSSADIVTAEYNVSVFASSTYESAPTAAPIGISEARTLATAAIVSVNAARSDLQSALDALTNLI